ncbi:MAG: hypothetical protein GX166_05770 [Clostridiaceae bacterium]|jgi:hypothetical protein|nr:hypothetical protein [Clostridiaceae bacterium]
MKISLYFYTIPQYLKCLSVIQEADFVYLPYEYFLSGSTKSKGKTVYVAGPDSTISYNAEGLSKEKFFMTFPYVLKGKTKTTFIRDFGSNTLCRHSYLLQNLGDITALEDLCQSRNYTIHADYSFNVQNTKTMDVLYEIGFKSVTLSPELSVDKLLNLSTHAESGFLLKEKYAETVCYGRIILMRSEHCYISDERGYNCGKCLTDDEYSLKDDNGNVFPVLSNPADCRSILLDRAPYMIKDADFLEKMRNMRSSILRLNIYDEDASTISALIKYFKYGLSSSETDRVKPYCGRN